MYLTNTTSDADLIARDGTIFQNSVMDLRSIGEQDHYSAFRDLLEKAAGGLKRPEQRAGFREELSDFVGKTAQLTANDYGLLFAMAEDLIRHDYHHFNLKKNEKAPTLNAWQEATWHAAPTIRNAYYEALGTAKQALRKLQSPYDPRNHKHDAGKGIENLIAVTGEQLQELAAALKTDAATLARIEGDIDVLPEFTIAETLLGPLARWYTARNGNNHPRNGEKSIGEWIAYKAKTIGENDQAKEKLWAGTANAYKEALPPAITHLSAAGNLLDHHYRSTRSPFYKMAM